MKTLKKTAAEPSVPLGPTADTLLLSNCRLFSRLAGLVGICAGLIVLVGGWALNIETLRSVFAGYSAMRPNTALGLLLIGVVLRLDRVDRASAVRRFFGQLCAGIAGLIGGVTLGEYVLGADHIDSLMFHHATLVLAPGRMAVMTAVSFLLLAGSLFCSRHVRGFAVGQHFAISAGVLSLFNVVGYLYGIKSFYSVAFHAESTAMAIHTSLVLVVLCAGVLFSRPDWGVMSIVTSQSPGGEMARRLLPAALLIPIAAGWLRWQGQLRGFYDTAFGLALFTSVTILVFAFFIGRSSKRLDRLDSIRVRAENTVRESEEQFRALLESAPDAMLIEDPAGRIVVVNARAESLFGYKREELLGGKMEMLIPARARHRNSGRMNAATEWMGLTRDGAQFSAEISLSPIQMPHDIWICSAIRDITERKRIAQQLRESESRFRTLLETLPQMVWTLNRDGGCDYLSPQWVEYTGIPETVQLGSGWTKQVHPQDRGRALASLSEALRARVRFDVELRIRSSSGEYRWFHGIAVPVHDSDGTVAKWFGTSTDIHDIKMAETALRRSEANFRLLADAMPQMAWTAGADGVCDYYNQRCSDYNGMTAAQMRDGGWASMIHPDDRRNTMECRTRAIAAGEPYAVEYRLKRASDGIYRWHLGRGVPALDSEGEIVRWIGTCTDIEGYKQAQVSIQSLNEDLETKVQKRTEELQASEERFRSLVEKIKDYAILMLDPQGHIVTWNAGAERIKGYAASEIVGRHFSLFYAMEDIENGHPEEALYRAATDGQFEEEGWRVRRDGSRFWAEVLITAVRDHAGQLQGFSKVTRDITERKRIQQQLIAETWRAEDANRAKSDFLATMSHEIRTPMNAILGMADMLWESQLDADQMHYVEVFRRAGSSLLALINDILDLSKIEAGLLDLESVEFDLEDVVDQAMELTAVKARAKGILLLSRLTPGVTTSLCGDPTRLKQILINLLGNAVKFTEVGEVVITVQNHQSGNPGEIEFSVRDTGVGIPADKLETVFDNFTQADASTTRKYGGTGLGLGISRRLVESMGGLLTAASSAGEGSTFRFNAKFIVAPQYGRKVQTELQDMHGRRVLVIDDDATNCLILRETLQGWGLESDVFGSPEKALSVLTESMAGERPYSLVLVDSCMPGMDGFETSAHIGRIAPGLPVAMLTSDFRPGDVARRLEAGLSGYAVKPIKRGDLLRLVSAALKPREGHNEHQLANPDRKTSEPGMALRILVAEDSPDNRLLIQAYMKGSPHILTFAEDGKGAVDRCTAEQFDLVLMDIQMPIMDGLSATRAIREIERLRGTAAMPIIALTANARPQDVEMSRKAGCTGHLSKPISKLTLLSHIQKYEIPVTRSLQPIRIEMPSGLEEIVPGYLAARREELPRMGDLLAASDFHNLEILAHNLKGNGDSYGFPDLTRLGTVLERSAQQQDTDAISAKLGELKDYLSKVELFAKV